MTTQEMIEVMKAYDKGKTIQWSSKANKTWADCTDEPCWNWNWNDYRIKPESKYRPYRDTEEMIEDFKKRFNAKVPPYAPVKSLWINNNGTVTAYNSAGSYYVCGTYVVGTT